LISFGLGSDANGSSLARNFIHLNVSVDELNPRNLTAFLFSGSSITASQNLSVNKTSGFNNVTFLSVADGYYNVSVSVRDLADNVNTTSTNRSFTVDTTVPVLAYAAPSLANASFVNVSWIFLNFSFTETNNGTLMIRNGSTNWTNVNASAGYFFYNFTNRNDGNYTFFGWVNDSAGNVVQTANRTVVVDTTAPAISLIANTPACDEGFCVAFLAGASALSPACHTTPGLNRRTLPRMEQRPPRPPRSLIETPEGVSPPIHSARPPISHDEARTREAGVSPACRSRG